MVLFINYANKNCLTDSKKNARLSVAWHGVDPIFYLVIVRCWNFWDGFRNSIWNWLLGDVF